MGTRRFATVGRASAAVGLAVLIGVGTLIYTLVSGNSGESKYVTMALPGTTRAQLPAGKVDVTFTADFSGQTVPVPAIQPDEMTVRLIGGGAGATFSQHIGAIDSDNDVIHVQVGTLSVPKAGTYRIVVDHESDLPAPQLHFGKRADNGPVLAGGLGLAGFLAVIGIGMFIAIGARRGRSVSAAGTEDLQPETPETDMPRTVLPRGQLPLDRESRLGLVHADATVLAAHDVAVPPGAPDAPPGGLVDLTFDVKFPTGDPGYATTARIAFGTPERRSQIAVVGRTWPVLVNPDVRDQLALDANRIPPAPA